MQSGRESFLHQLNCTGGHPLGSRAKFYSGSKGVSGPPGHRKACESHTGCANSATPLDTHPACKRRSSTAKYANKTCPWSDGTSSYTKSLTVPYRTYADMKSLSLHPTSQLPFTIKIWSSQRRRDSSVITPKYSTVLHNKVSFTSLVSPYRRFQGCSSCRAGMD